MSNAQYGYFLLFSKCQLHTTHSYNKLSGHRLRQCCWQCSEVQPISKKKKFRILAFFLLKINEIYQHKGACHIAMPNSALKAKTCFKTKLKYNTDSLFLFKTASKRSKKNIRQQGGWDRFSSVTSHALGTLCSVDLDG